MYILTMSFHFIGVNIGILVTPNKDYTVTLKENISLLFPEESAVIAPIDKMGYVYVSPSPTSL